MGKKFSDRFDYENAKRDIFDAGGDPDYLSHRDPAKRDQFMKEMGMDPKKYGSRWEQSRENGRGSSDEGCFLTSACAAARGLPDDCEELTLLRRYRDTYLKHRKGGEREILEYYSLAPQIVRRINEKENAGEIWSRVYEEMVLPCVRMIRQNRMEEAYFHYKACTRKLAEL